MFLISKNLKCSLIKICLYFFSISSIGESRADFFFLLEELNGKKYGFWNFSTFKDSNDNEKSNILDESVENHLKESDIKKNIYDQLVKSVKKSVKFGDNTNINLKNSNRLDNANLTINPLSEVNPIISASVESVCDKKVEKILSYIIT